MKPCFEVHRQIIGDHWIVCPCLLEYGTAVQINGRSEGDLSFNGEAEVTVNPMYGVLAAGVVGMTSQTSARGRSITHPIPSPHLEGENISRIPQIVNAPHKRSRLL